ncbi:sulfite exporter TauE/SafE family protein [Pigmentiphaga aceris]|uniref:Probable membrane transporter protein n=1 Tax=Pigmentiphaga aceris TaxID=1940612 RepID=A0A5C0ARV5_9BURK|nr:sulfite exporter TauE/SafE family protein [Pigmentiphaga aceris]QEI04848.1 sulfite exporter TauE/SafE family protein [Pigmentiphaga aceris]
MDTVYLVVALGAAVAGFVQGLSGFAFGMVAMSFWAWVLDPRLAATLVVFGALLGQVLAAVTVRRAVDVKRLLPFLVGGLAGVPLGVALLPYLDMDGFKTMLGLLLVCWCPAMLWAAHVSKTQPKIQSSIQSNTSAKHRLADGAVGVAGGMLGGLGGFTGVVPTLWCTLRGFDKDSQRAIIQNFNLAMLLTTMGTYLAKGMVTRDMLPLFAIVAPAMLIPTLWGAKLYIGISEARFRQIVLVLLSLSGLAMLGSSLPRLLERMG